jgi:phosphatidate cytidylyltransferase
MAALAADTKELMVGDFARRAAAALVLAPIALAAVWSGGLVFAGLVALAAVVMSYEWDRLAGGDGFGLGAAALMAVQLAAVAAMTLGEPGVAAVVLAVGVVALTVLTKWRGGAAAMGALGVVAIGLPCVAIVWMRGLPTLGVALVLWLLAVVWATDIAAYLVGRTAGGPKLAPKISPGKTWSGLFGGLVAAALVGAGAGALLFRDPALWPLAGLATACAVVAQTGDLCESALKRRRGVKDTSGLIPGHGGLLDRLDGLITCAPFLAAVTLLGEESGPLWQ